MKKNTVIVDAVRLGVGSFLGSLSDVSYVDLGGAAIRELMNRTKYDGPIDEVIMGNIVCIEPKGNPAREAALNAGIPIEVPAFSVNKNCASSLKSIALGAMQIGYGESDVIIAGGMGQRAINLFNERKINVFVGAPIKPAKDLASDLLNDTLSAGANYCDH